MTVNSIKEQHLKDVRQALISMKSATKPQLAGRTGLSVVTINSLVKILLENGEIMEEEQTIANGGRPAAVYSLNRNYKLALVFGTREQGGTDRITASVVNICDELVEPEQQFSQLSIQNLDFSIRYYTQKYPAIRLIAFALPAKERDGRLIFCDYEELNGFPLREYISEHYHLPCLIENDIRISVLGYFLKNPSPDTKVLAGIYFPRKYSVGVGLLVNGNLYQGAGGIASEIEYLPAFADICWEERTLEQNIELIKTVCVMYNPDTVLLYDAFLTEENFRAIEKAFEEGAYCCFKPRFIRISEIEEYYMYGLRQYALGKL